MTRIPVLTVVADNPHGPWASLLLACGHETRRRLKRRRSGDPGSARLGPKFVKKCEACDLLGAQNPTTIPVQFHHPTRSIARVSSNPRSIVQVDIVQGGRVLRKHTHEGQSYFEVPQAGEYQIRLRNTTGVRKLAVLSVDGVNVVDGETAGYEGTGYVLGAYQTANIKGWRRTDSEVAAFQFDASTQSYANKTGRGTKNTGVIGVALFDEAAPTTTNFALNTGHSTPLHGTWTMESATPSGKLPNIDLYSQRNDEGSAVMDSAPMEPDSLGAADMGTVYAANAACAASEESDDGFSRTLSSSPTRSRRVTKGAPSLGTGYGQQARMYTTETTFKRASETPSAVLVFRYGVRAKLKEWGVPLPDLHQTPSAFPASTGPSVPAPPGWRG